MLCIYKNASASGGLHPPDTLPGILPLDPTGGLSSRPHMTHFAVPPIFSPRLHLWWLVVVEYLWDMVLLIVYTTGMPCSFVASVAAFVATDCSFVASVAAFVATDCSFVAVHCRNGQWFTTQTSFAGIVGWLWLFCNEGNESYRQCFNSFYFGQLF